MPSPASAHGPSAGLLMTPFPSSPHPPDVSHVFPEFPAPDLGSVLLQESITLQDVKALQLAYRRHCEVTAPSRWPPRKSPHLGCGDSVGTSVHPGPGCRAQCAYPGLPNPRTSPGVPDNTEDPERPLLPLAKEQIEPLSPGQRPFVHFHLHCGLSLISKDPLPHSLNHH